MKKFILIFILCICFQSSIKADDIKDFEIEGISIGDNALKYFTVDEINKDKYDIYTNIPYYVSFFKAGSVYTSGFEISDTYDVIKLTFKKNDKTFAIYSLQGIKYYKNFFLKRYIYETAKLLSEHTQARRISGLRSFFDYLIFEKYRSTNPTDLVETPKLGKKLPAVLSISEIELIIKNLDLSHPQGHRNKAIIETLYGSGLRVSEIVNLNLSNLFFKESLIQVTGKGNKQRLVPMGSVSKKSLEIT